MRKDICVQHWVSNGETRDAFEYVYDLVFRIANFI
jgi:hypothetical protein